MNEVEECFEKGLLKKAVKSGKLALQGLRQAEFFLNESFDLINLMKKEMAAIALSTPPFTPREPKIPQTNCLTSRQ